MVFANNQDFNKFSDLNLTIMSSCNYFILYLIHLIISRNCLQQLEANAEIYRDDDQQDPGFMLLGN